MIGAGNASRKASRMADEARNKDATSLHNKAKHAIAGIGGALMGGVAGAKAFADAKDNYGSAAWNAAQKRNAEVLSNGAKGVTVLGRTGANASRMFFGETKADRIERQLEAQEKARKTADALVSFADGKAKTTNWTKGESTLKDADGNVIKRVTGNYQAWTFAKQAAESQGKDSFEFNGVTVTLEEANALDYELMTTNSSNYIQNAGSIPEETEFRKVVEEYKSANPGHDVGTTTVRKDIKDVISNIDGRITELQDGHSVAKANAEATKPS